MHEYFVLSVEEIHVHACHVAHPLPHMAHTKCHSLGASLCRVGSSEVDGPSVEQVLDDCVWQQGWEGAGYVCIRDYS